MQATNRVLTWREAREVAGDLEAIEKALDKGPPESWRNRCHEISHALLRTGLFGPGRVARGWGEGIVGQHSWIVLGDDCYDPQAVIVDPTRLVTSEGKPEVEVTRNLAHHVPHGNGNIFRNGSPPPLPGEDTIKLAGYDGLSERAKRFLQSCFYPLDWKGWAHLAHGPMGGWPSGEIISAICDTPQLKAITPIDIVGMVTDRNPGGMYR